MSQPTPSTTQSGAPSPSMEKLSPHPVIRYYPTWQVVLSRRASAESLPDPAFFGPADPLPSKKAIRGQLHHGRQAGADFVYYRTPAGFEYLAETLQQVRFLGYSSVVEYLADICILSSEVKGPGNRSLRPILDAGSIAPDDLCGLAEVVDHFRFEACVYAPIFTEKNLDEMDTEKLSYRQRNAPATWERLCAEKLPVVLSLWMRTMPPQDNLDVLRRRIEECLEDGGNILAVHINPAMPFGTLSRGGAGDELMRAEELDELARKLRNILPNQIEVWIETAGRVDLLSHLRNGAPYQLGGVCLNGMLPSGQTKGEWFSEEVGPLDPFLWRKLPSRPLADGLRSNGQAGSANPPLPVPPAQSAPSAEELPYYVTPEGLLTDGVAVWKPCTTIGGTAA